MAIPLDLLCQTIPSPVSGRHEEVVPSSSASGVLQLFENTPNVDNKPSRHRSPKHRYELRPFRPHSPGQVQLHRQNPFHSKGIALFAETEFSQSAPCSRETSQSLNKICTPTLAIPTQLRLQKERRQREGMRPSFQHTGARDKRRYNTTVRMDRARTNSRRGRQTDGRTMKRQTDR